MFKGQSLPRDIAKQLDKPEKKRRKCDKEKSWMKPVSKELRGCPFMLSDYLS